VTEIPDSPAAKLEPVTVTEPPDGPLLLLREMDGVTLKTTLGTVPDTVTEPKASMLCEPA
jgi:hypothetical protein